MKKNLEKEIYETPVVMEISPVSFVAGKSDSGHQDEMGESEMEGGDSDPD